MSAPLKKQMGKGDKTQDGNSVLLISVWKLIA